MKSIILKLEYNTISVRYYLIQNMYQVDLDDITTKSIRLRLESDLNEKFDELKVGKLPTVTESIISDAHPTKNLQSQLYFGIWFPNFQTNHQIFYHYSHYEARTHHDRCEKLKLMKL